MKKAVIILLVCIFVTISNAYSTGKTTNNVNQNAKNKIVNIGQTILTKNSLPREVTFNVVENQEANAYADANNQIVVYTGLLNLVENDDELAGILSHEVGHIMKSHCYKQTFVNIALNYVSSKFKTEKGAVGAQIASTLVSNKVSREYEYDADYTSADLVYKAGYNPLGLISALNKISGNYVDILSDHPSGDKRLLALYDYINYNYPDAVKKSYNTTSYKNFMAYAQPTLEKRASSEKEANKYIKTQQKLKKKRDKAAKKMMKTNDQWAMGYSTLMLMSGQQQ